MSDKAIASKTFLQFVGFPGSGETAEKASMVQEHPEVQVEQKQKVPTEVELAYERAVKELNVLSDQFVIAMTTPRNRSETRAVITTLLTKLVDVMLSPGCAPCDFVKYGVSISERKIGLLTDAYMIVYEIVLIESDLAEYDGKQAIVKSSLARLLQMSLRNNFHNFDAPCMALNDNKCNFDHPFVNDGSTFEHGFKCDFHWGDSLSTHLVLTSICDTFWALSQSEVIRPKVLAAVALYGAHHDIGKVHTAMTYEFGGSLFTGFPAHAEAGAKMFQAHWNDKMAEYISKEMYFFVCDAILRHMCGYHGDEDASTAYKRDLLLLDTDTVRSLLTFNRIGDHCGKLPCYEDVMAENTAKYLEQQVLFEKHMTLPGREHFNILDFMQKYLIYHQANKKTVSIKTDKMVLFLIGPSGAGKSWLSRLISQRYPTVICGRDECIAQVCIGASFRLCPEDYEVMYQIYDAGKRKSFDDYVKAQEGWNKYITEKKLDFAPVEVITKPHQLPLVSKLVTDLYAKNICEALKSSATFVIVDTFMACFPGAMKYAMPCELKYYFRHHIHVQSYVERMNSNVGTSLKDGLAVGGYFGMEYPFHPGSSKDARSLSAFASLSSQRQVVGSVPKSAFYDTFRPHLVSVVTRTPQGNFGYDSLLETLDILAKPITEANTKAIEASASASSSAGDEQNDGVQDEQIEDEDTFGVDPSTKDLAVDKFYLHLLKEHKGDRREIREFLRTLGGDDGRNGFMHNCFIECSYDSLGGDEKKAYCEKLSAISVAWKKNHIVKACHSIDAFMKHDDLRDSYIFSIVTLKYFESWGARFWVKYAKEMRGTILFVNPETLRVKIMSFKLPRGAEVMTGLLKNSGIDDTQDIKAGKVSILDIEQQDTCTRLCKNQSINAYITSKGDGSLLVINIYSGKALAIMEPIARIFGDEYIHTWVDQSLAVTGGKYIAIPATQGTVMEGGFMASYMVTSMLVGAGILSRKALVDTGLNYVEAWKQFGVKFIEKLFTMTFFDDLTDVHTLLFEAMCANRKGAFKGDNPHNELAVNYAKDRLIFLGISIAERRFYIPHMLYGTKSKIPFKEPLWWKIKHAGKLQAIMKDLGSLIRRKLTREQFFNKHRPDNKDFDAKIAVLDYEGVIVMKEATYKTDDADWSLVELILGLPRTIYSKNKLEEYYRAHKFHVENIPYLVQLATDMVSVSASASASAFGDVELKEESDEYESSFHLATKVADLFAPGALAERLRLVGAATMEILDFKDSNCPVLASIREAHVRAVNEAKAKNKEAEALRAKGEKVKDVKIPKDPLKGFYERSFNTQCRIALNIRGFNFGKLLVPIFSKIFPTIDDALDNLPSTLNSLTMELKPWAQGYEDRIKDLNPTSPCAQGLIKVCMGQEIV